jgi:hypothetical protein
VWFFPDQDDFNAQVNGLGTLDLVRKKEAILCSPKGAKLR